VSQLARKLLALSEQHSTRLVYGVAASSTTVYINGSTVAVTVPALDDVSMSTDDYVAILQTGADALILGVVA
jgi:hypothetical protein